MLTCAALGLWKSEGVRNIFPNQNRRNVLFIIAGIFTLVIAGFTLRTVGQASLKGHVHINVVRVSFAGIILFPFGDAVCAFFIMEKKKERLEKLMIDSGVDPNSLWAQRVIDGTP